LFIEKQYYTFIALQTELKPIVRGAKSNIDPKGEDYHGTGYLHRILT